MRKIAIINLIILICIFISSCSQTTVNPPVTINNEFFPLNEGNYWVYTVSQTGENAKYAQFTDSILIAYSPTDTIPNKTLKLLLFRDNKLLNILNFTSNDSIMKIINSNYGYPFLKDYNSCDCSSGYIKFLDYKNNSWTLIQTDVSKSVGITRDTVRGGDTIIEINIKNTLQLQTNLISKQNDVSFEGKATTQYQIIGDLKSQIIGPITTSYVKDTTCSKYYIDNQTLLKYNAHFDLYLVKGIGLVKINQVYNKCGDENHTFTSQLIRYKVK